jgi:hypothetical protein
MKKTIGMTIMTAALLVLIGGCLLMTGQSTFYRRIDIGVTTNTAVTAVPVDLNEEQDYLDHRDEIKSVDAISVVAIIQNNLPAAAKMEIYISDNAGLTTVDGVKSEAKLVFVSPTVPASDKLKIGWADGFKYMVDEKPVIEQVLGDGIFVVYAIADETPFSLDVKAEIGITFTVGK